MKKSLVLALVLVFAFASSVFAGVSVGGEFEAKLALPDTATEFDFGAMELTNTLSLSVKATGEEVDLWSFEANVLSFDEFDNIEIEKYKLTLTDDYFTLNFWGLNKELSTKGTDFGFISAPKKAVDDRVRLEVPVEELATVTADLDPEDNVKAFVDVPYGDNSFGVALQHDFATDVNTVVGYGEYDANGFATVNGAVGMTLDADDNLAFGLGVTVPVTDEVEVYADYEARQTGFANDADQKVFNAGLSYTEAQLKATVDYNTETTYAGTFDGGTIDLAVAYRLSETLGYDDLFDDDEWFKNDAPAFELAASFTDSANYDATLSAAAPLLADVAWARASANYAVVDDADGVVTLGVDGYVKANERLTLKPYVGYATDGKIVTLENTAEYAFGDAATLSVVLGQVTAEDAADESKTASVAVTVEF